MIWSGYSIPGSIYLTFQAVTNLASLKLLASCSSYRCLPNAVKWGICKMSRRCLWIWGDDSGSLFTCLASVGHCVLGSEGGHLTFPVLSLAFKVLSNLWRHISKFPGCPLEPLFICVATHLENTFKALVAADGHMNAIVGPRTSCLQHYVANLTSKRTCAFFIEIIEEIQIIHIFHELTFLFVIAHIVSPLGTVWHT